MKRLFRVFVYPFHGFFNGFIRRDFNAGFRILAGYLTVNVRCRSVFVVLVFLFSSCFCFFFFVRHNILLFVIHMAGVNARGPINLFH